MLKYSMARIYPPPPHVTLNDHALFHSLGFVQGNNDSTIHGLISGGIKYLDSRTEFWRQQKPLYARKKEKPVLHRNKPKAKTEDPADFVVRSLEEIDQKLSDGDLQDSLKQAENTLRQVKGMNDKAIPNKQEVIANLHSCIGNAFLEMEETVKALENHKKDLNISKKLCVNNNSV
jgi:ATP-dependent protease HslVU (ClpYQ) ATPase subunit